MRYNFLSDLGETNPHYRCISSMLKDKLIEFSYNLESYKRYENAEKIRNLDVRQDAYEQWVNEIAELFDIVKEEIE